MPSGRSTTSRSTSSRGRRPGAPDTRADVLAAARRLFAERGFRGTTIRAVAGEAGVDPSLVHHYFGTKDDLLVAALALPVDPREVLRPVVEAGPEGAGERLLRTFLGVWDAPETQGALLAVARTALDPDGSRLVKDGFIPVVVGPVLESLVKDRPEARIPLVVSQVLGLIVSRYVVAVPSVAQLSAEELVAGMGPVLQHYLTGDLGDAVEARSGA